MTLLPAAVRVFGKEGEFYAQVGNRIVGPWPMKGYARAGLQTELRRLHNMEGTMVTTKVLREATIVFPDPRAAEEFGKFCRGFFQGTPTTVSGAEVAPPRVKLRGLLAGEAQMFAREAAKIGGLIEISQEAACPTI